MMRGVSPVVSVILLAAIAAAAAVLAYFFVSSYQAGLQRQAGSLAGGIGKCLKVEGVEVAGADAWGVSFRIWLRNCGETPLHLDYVFILDPSLSAKYTYYAGDWVLRESETQYLWLWVPRDKLVNHGVNLIKITTKEGVEAYYSFRVEL